MDLRFEDVGNGKIITTMKGSTKVARYVWAAGGNVSLPLLIDAIMREGAKPAKRSRTKTKGKRTKAQRVAAAKKAWVTRKANNKKAA